jgi:cytoskeletal protein CcmA (bactofilin family)
VAPDGAIDEGFRVKASKVVVTCPKCGHTQHEPSTAYSSVCKKCRQYFRLEEVLSAQSAPRPRPSAEAPPAPRRDLRHVTCFACGTALEVSTSAQSTMCKRCSAHVDLKDHQITGAVSKNFRTKGRIVIEEGAFLFNTETTASEVILKGRFLGKLVVEGTLEFHRTAELKGTFKAGRFLVPAGQVIRWADILPLTDAEIVGELIANVRATGTVLLRAGARYFGNIEAANLVVEPGAVLVGNVRLGAVAVPV